MQAFVIINRVAPDARDASVSSVGHEPYIRSQVLQSHEMALEFVGINAPELIGATPELESRRNNNSYSFHLKGRDHRGYFTYASISEFN